MKTTSIGKLGEARVLTELIKFDIPVFIPFQEDTVVDLIAIFDNIPVKIQIKSSSQEEKIGKVNFDLTKQKNILYDKKDIDFFAFCCLDWDNCMLVPFQTLEGKSGISFYDEKKYIPASNFKGLKYQDYIFEKILNKKDLIERKKQENINNKISSKQKFYCIDCGIEISRFGKRCKSCAAKENQHILGNKGPEQISREELKDLIFNTPFVKIGQQFSVSDNTIRKWCRYYSLPDKKRDIKKYSEEEWAQI